MYCLALRKLLTFIWTSVSLGALYLIGMEGGRVDRQIKHTWNFLRIVLLLLLLSLVSFIWLGMESIRQQANQDVRFCFCFKNYNLLNKNITKTFQWVVLVIWLFQKQEEVWQLYSNSGYCKWRHFLTREMLSWEDGEILCLSSLFLFASFLASTNACETLFPLMDLDVKTMSIL